MTQTDAPDAHETTKDAPEQSDDISACCEDFVGQLGSAAEKVVRELFGDGTTIAGIVAAIPVSPPIEDNEDNKDDDNILTLIDMLHLHNAVKMILSVVVPEAGKSAWLDYHNAFLRRTPEEHKQSVEAERDLRAIQLLKEELETLHRKLHTLLTLTSTGLAPIPF